MEEKKLIPVKAIIPAELTEKLTEELETEDLEDISRLIDAKIEMKLEEERIAREKEENYNKLVGKVARRTIKDPETKKPIVRMGRKIDEEKAHLLADKIANKELNDVKIRESYKGKGIKFLLKTFKVLLTAGVAAGAVATLILTLLPGTKALAPLVAKLTVAGAITDFTVKAGGNAKDLADAISALNPHFAILGASR